MFDFLNKDKLPKSARNYFLPSREFIERGKTVFLARFKEKFPRGIPDVRFALAVRIAGIMAIVFVATNVAAVYADEKNVDPTNPLYPLKRYSEVLQSAFTTGNKETELHVGFAKRRLEEIEILNKKISGSEKEKENAVQPGAGINVITVSTSALPSGDVSEPESGNEREVESVESKKDVSEPRKYDEKIGNLMDDLEKEVEFSLDKIQAHNREESGNVVICKSLQEFVATGSSVAVDGFISRKPGILKKFESKCNPFFDSEDKKTED